MPERRERREIKRSGDGYPLRWGEKEEAFALRIFLDLDLDILLHAINDLFHDLLDLLGND